MNNAEAITQAAHKSLQDDCQRTFGRDYEDVKAGFMTLLDRLENGDRKLSETEQRVFGYMAERAAILKAFEEKLGVRIRV